jgi:sirohydrochlorin cobaltochelatase
VVTGEIVSQLGQLTIRIGEDDIAIEGPATGQAPRAVPGDPASLRRWIRFDDAGRYRPLSGARSMRANWQADLPSIAAMDAAIEAVYPLALEHLAAASEGRLRIVGLDEVLSRQSGRYQVAAGLGTAGRDAATAVLCARCVKSPAWAGGATPPGGIPCPEPCSVLVALCREAALWEREPPEAAPVNAEAAFADFETPGNEVREAYLRLRKDDLG